MCKRLKIGKLLCFFSAFCMAFCIISLSFDSPVAADAVNGVQLNYQQTLALYGSSFTASCYSVYTQESFDLTFNYVCTAESWDESTSTFPQMPFRTVSAINNEIPLWYQYPGLVYAVACNPFSASGSGPLYNSFYVNSLPTYCNTSFSFPINLDGITQFSHNVFWCYNSTINSRYDNSYAALQTSSGLIRTNASKFSSSSDFLARGYMPTKYHGPFETVPVESKWLAFFAGILQEPVFNSPTTITGESFVCNTLGSVSDMAGEDLYGTTFTGSDLGIVYIIIGCPYLVGYNPPVETTTTLTTRETGVTAALPVTASPAQTVDLSTLESGVAAIVQQEQFNGDTLDWIGQNTAIGVNNLYYICNMLDKIYDNMVNSGQIAVDLVPADPLHTLSPSVHDGIDAALTNFTTSQIPQDASNGFSFYNTLYSLFTSGDLSFFGWLGIFSLITLTLGWLIFKGRG